MSDATYQRGYVDLSMESLLLLADEGLPKLLQDCVFGVQINEDGRVWICVNGATFLRFKPSGKSLVEK